MNTQKKISINKPFRCFVATVLSCTLLAGLAGCAQTSSNESAETSSATDASASGPLTASLIADGTYDIEVESSSSMFKIVKAKLTVQGDKMTCAMTLSGTGYEKLFMGTGEEALNADDSEFIYFTEDADGAYVYTVPVEALDTDINCAAWSIRKEQWYDRVLVFKSETLPADAILSEPKPTADAADADALKNLEDGTYAVDVTLEGGSGRATVESPATLTVDNKKVTAHIVWSSSNYDQMVVDGTQYLPVNNGGNSAFDIPVATLDAPLAVSAETTAMSTPHMVDYTLTFDVASAQRADA